MPLWYETGQGLEPANFKRLESNLDVYFCCPGPSLNSIPAEKLNGPGRLVAAVNNAYPYVRPDIWFGMDDPKCYSRQIFWEPFIKIMRAGYNSRNCEGKEIKNNFNLYYADVEKYKNPELIFLSNLNKANVNFIWTQNVISVALHILLWMGAKNIYFVGCDLDNTKQDYHHGQVLDGKNKKWNASLYNDLYIWIKWFTRTSKKYNIKLKCCSPNSKLNNIMDYTPIEDALKNSQALIPTGGDLIHTLDIKAS
tara:strand:- start:3545 stop:4300 length:756 start_codon:yes stop_codon:yes gene_type:complete